MKNFKLPAMCMAIRFVSALIFAGLLQLAGGVFADTILGKVVAITDGDTVTVLGAGKTQHTIHLAGIAAPERKMPFGQRSKEYLFDLVFSKDVVVEANKKDRYGRTVGNIFVDGRDANFAMVGAGMAWHGMAWHGTISDTKGNRRRQIGSFIPVPRMRRDHKGRVCGGMITRHRHGNIERSNAVANHQNTLPTTVDESVRLLQGLVPEVEQARIAVMQEGELITLHFGLGQWVRNHLGLWGDNPALLQSTGEQNADDASGIIIRAFWQKLQEDLPKLH